MGVNVTKPGILIYRDAEFEPKISDNVPNSETDSFTGSEFLLRLPYLYHAQETIARE